MNHQREPWIVVVGGFLASGKTTLILAAAQELERRGLRCAALFNDQGSDLVDRHYAANSGLFSGEVVGGCFCCRFSNLVEEIHRIQAFGPDVIFAEPVGSCTDLAATVLRPLRELPWEDGARMRLAPLTVLADPKRVRALLAGDAVSEMRYLFEKQIQEADLVCFTKSDLYPDIPPLNLPHVRQLSARTGQGVAAWLDEVLSGAITAAGQPLDIDYIEYARAEAALAWLNLHAEFHLREPQSPAMLLGPLFDEIDNALSLTGAPIAHMKAIVSTRTGFVKAAIAAHGQEPVLEGNLDASPASRLEFVLNLRAEGQPETIRRLVERPLRKFGSQLTEMELNCFSPAPPVPEQRIAAKLR